MGYKYFCRGSQHLAGSVVLPSEEDSQTFTLNFATGEVWKVRASHAKERQMWVDRLRACAHIHNEARAHTHSISAREKRPPTPPGSRSHFSNGEPSDQLQTLSLSVLDAFGSAHDILNKVDKKHLALVETIEALPPKRTSPGLEAGEAPALTCHDPRLLRLKATSAATVRCVEAALSILQELRGHELGPPVVVHQSIPLPTAFSPPSVSLLPGDTLVTSSLHPRNLVTSGSPAHSSRSISLSIPTTPARVARPKSADITKITQH